MKKSKLFQSWGTFRKGLDAQSIQLSFASHLEYSLSKDQHTSTNRDLYHSLALAARDRLIERWIKTQQNYYTDDVKRVYYLSAEYLMGRALVNNLINLDMYDGNPQGHGRARPRPRRARRTRSRTPASATAASAAWPPASSTRMAALEMPGYGYGIRYEFGIFEQDIRDWAR